MPPHCDTMDGPVVKAARQALEAARVDLVLPYVPKEGEAEVIAAFEKVMEARKPGGTVREVVDLYFFETVVRVHRAGEGAPYSGLKPAGLDPGPVCRFHIVRLAWAARVERRMASGHEIDLGKDCRNAPLRAR